MKPDAGKPPTALPGPTATQILGKGWRSELVTFLCTVCFGFESKLGRYEALWIACFGAIAVVSIVRGVVLMVLGYRKSSAEVRLGYTTGADVARQHVELWYVHPKTLQILAYPGQPRPSRVGTAERWAQENPEMPYLERSAAMRKPQRRRRNRPSALKP